MASTIYTVVELELLDGSTVQARPLNIKLLRKFMKEFAKMEGEGVRTDNDKALNVLMKCAAVAMEQFRPDLTLDQLEEVLEIQTLYKIIEVASGIKMTGDDEGKDLMAGLGQI